MKQVVFRHLKQRLEGGLSPLPPNCAHNGLVSLRDSKIGVCLLGSDSPHSWEGKTCDMNMGGAQQARQCPYFQCKNTSDSIRGEMRDLLSGPVHKIAAVYPDVAALMWVLDGDRETLESVVDFSMTYRVVTVAQPLSWVNLTLVPP